MRGPPPPKPPPPKGAAPGTVTDPVQELLLLRLCRSPTLLVQRKRPNVDRRPHKGKRNSSDVPELAVPRVLWGLWCPGVRPGLVVLRKFLRVSSSGFIWLHYVDSSAPPLLYSCVWLRLSAVSVAKTLPNAVPEPLPGVGHQFGTRAFSSSKKLLTRVREVSTSSARVCRAASHRVRLATPRRGVLNIAEMRTDTQPEVANHSF